MILLPPDIRAKLLANGADRGPDHAPLLKLFNPIGAATWLASQLYEDGDTLLRLCRVQHKPNYVERGIMLSAGRFGRLAGGSQDNT